MKNPVTLSSGSGKQKEDDAEERRDVYFLDVPPGDHELQIVAIGFSFPPIVVSVDRENDEEVVMRYSEHVDDIAESEDAGENDDSDDEEE